MEDVGPEPWLRGPIEGIPAEVMPVFFSFQQVREELGKHTAGISDELVWREVAGSSLGFHLKHIAGSVDRLATYLAGEKLGDDQLRFLKEESAGGASLQDLLALVYAALHGAEQKVMQLDRLSFSEARTVGRKKLPTTVIGLLVHLCEHTQRHLGQAITICKFLKQPS